MPPSSVCRVALTIALAAGAVTPARAQGTYPYVIVTDTTLVGAFAPLAAAHSSAGLPAVVRTVQSIRTQYPSGRDDAERIRMFLQDAHAQWGAHFVLLGGDEPLVPMRRVLARLSVGSSASDVLLPTDQYYACLAGSWNADGDEFWGELPYPSLGEPGDDVSFLPDLSVGRAPVTTVADAQIFVQKTLAALAGRSGMTGSVSVLMVAAAQQIGPTLLDGATQTEALLPIIAGLPGSSVSRLYLNSSAWPGSDPESRASVLASLEQGFDIAVLSGAGGPGIFVAGAHPQDDLVPADLLPLRNPRPMLAYVLSAFTNPPGTASIGAALLGAPNGGAVAVVGSTDIQFTFTAGTFMRTFFDQLVNQHAPTLGDALALAIANFPAGPPLDDFSRLSRQGNVLLGDPALPPPWAIDGPTPVELSLVSAEARADGVTLTWYTSGASGLVATVERRTQATDWSAVGRTAADGTGQLAFHDAAVDPGVRYGYRLRLGNEQFFGEAWVTMPVPGLALLGLRTNPATRDLTVRFALPDDAPARLELFDMGGRLVRADDVGRLGAGSHAMDLAGGHMPPPGIYWVRLTRAGRSLTARACVLR